MQSENFDNKIRQAAEQHHPNYDEKAWSKMEKLLDQHLPQKKDDRRRFLFVLLFIFLLGGGAWLFISRPWNAGRTVVAGNSEQVKATPNTGAVSAQPSVTSDKESNAPVHSDAAPVEPISSPQTNAHVGQSATAPFEGKSAGSSKVFARKNIAAEQILSVDQSNPAVSKKNTKPSNTPTDGVPDNGITNNNAPADNSNVLKTAAAPVVTTSPGADNKDVQSDNKRSSVGAPEAKATEAVKDEAKGQPAQPSAQKQVAKKGMPKKNSFFFSLSAGPDRSSVKMDNPGQVKLLVGAGAGFTFHDRWTIKTGFYSSSKVYTASKYDYKPPTPIVNPNYLDEIYANCKVYEIPLNVSYNFSNADKHSFFATTGLSSFIMKKEEYQYRYVYPTNPPSTYTYTKTINNENQHYFSVLTLSGGYEYRFSKSFSLSAEPYLKLPLAGIGFGKVKLSSSGLLFSATLRPFH